MDDKEISKIVSYLKPEYKMFEWGCGGSTIYFSKYVTFYRSIEHDRKWFEKITQLIESNTELYHYENKNKYYEYVNSISQYNDIYDVILIDGRSRVDCAVRAKSYLKHDGILFVHDYFNRQYYHQIEKEYTLIDEVKNTEQTLAVFKNEIYN